MEEFDQYRIVLDSQDIEKIVEDYAVKVLKKKGYELDHIFKEASDYFPEMTFRGVKKET